MELMFEKEEQQADLDQNKGTRCMHGQKPSAFAKSFQWIGYDVVGMDQVADPMGKRNMTVEK
ncbi:MAG: hypothetical protein MZU84_00565 [Sphingobacterium sp.]|nr:hypothetical protein [Sphingobacterium sp.]